MELRKKVENFPNKPGVYIFKDENSKPLYIGKARNLKKRVMSYFSSNNSSKIRTMLEKAKDIDYIVVGSENEALLLEANMIYEEKPPYNTLLKEMRVYPFIVVTDETFPSLKMVRERSIEGEYFGPYSSVSFAKELMNISYKIFKIRSCSLKINDKKRRKPCLEFHIGRCLAPCAGKITQEEYMKHVENLKKFLKGDIKGVLKKLQKDMKRMVEILDFEKAASIKNLIESIFELLQPQGIVLPDEKRMDVIYFKDELGVVLKIRNGFMLGKMSYSFAGDLSEFLEQFYSIKKEDLPSEILLNDKPSEQIVKWLKTSFNILTVSTPNDDVEKEMLEMAHLNWEEEVKMKENMEKSLKRLSEIVKLGKMPIRIEGIDVSHTHGLLTVSSVVVFENGKPNKREYRRYKFDEIKMPNDFEIIKMTVQRRYTKHEVPDLLLIDGGIQQVKFAMEGLKKIGKSCKVLGIVKGEEKLIDETGKEFILPMDDDVLRLLVRVRDEAHRFANSYHSKLRDKRLVISKLEDIPGIGKKRKKKLLETFKSVDNIARSTIDEIKKVVGSEVIARRTKEYLKKVMKNA